MHASYSNFIQIQFLCKDAKILYVRLTTHYANRHIHVFVDVCIYMLACKQKIVHVYLMLPSKDYSFAQTILLCQLRKGFLLMAKNKG